MNNEENNNVILIKKNSTNKEINLNEIKKLTLEDGLIWINLNFNSKQSNFWLKNESNVDEVVLDALLAEDTRPRYFIHDDGALLILRAINLNPGFAADDMVSLRLWIDKSKIITIYKRNVIAISDLKEEILKNKGPKTQGEFISRLTKFISLRMSESINSISTQVDEIEESVFDNKDKPEGSIISELRRQIIRIRRYLAPQAEILCEIQKEDITFFSNNDLALLRETADRLTRYVEDLDAAKERITVVKDEAQSQLATRMNNTMYLLSIITAIFLPLGLITSLLGINVAGIPFSNNPFAFTFVTLLLIIIAIIQIIIFKHKNIM